LICQQKRIFLHRYPNHPSALYASTAARMTPITTSTVINQCFFIARTGLALLAADRTLSDGWDTSSGYIANLRLPSSSLTDPKSIDSARLCASIASAIRLQRSSYTAPRYDQLSIRLGIAIREIRVVTACFRIKHGALEIRKGITLFDPKTAVTDFRQCSRLIDRETALYTISVASAANCQEHDQYRHIVVRMQCYTPTHAAAKLACQTKDHCRW
jgi:hypothetical protein